MPSASPRPSRPSPSPLIRHCSSCRGALALTQRLELAGVVVFALAAGLRWGLEPWFRYRPYRHARR